MHNSFTYFWIFFRIFFVDLFFGFFLDFFWIFFVDFFRIFFGFFFWIFFGFFLLIFFGFFLDFFWIFFEFFFLDFFSKWRMSVGIRSAPFPRCRWAVWLCWWWRASSRWTLPKSRTSICTIIVSRRWRTWRRTRKISTCWRANGSSPCLSSSQRGTENSARITGSGPRNRTKKASIPN